MNRKTTHMGLSFITPCQNGGGGGWVLEDLNEISSASPQQHVFNRSCIYKCKGETINSPPRHSHAIAAITNDNDPVNSQRIKLNSTLIFFLFKKLFHSAIHHNNFKLLRNKRICGSKLVQIYFLHNTKADVLKNVVTKQVWFPRTSNIFFVHIIKITNSYRFGKTWRWVKITDLSSYTEKREQTKLVYSLLWNCFHSEIAKFHNNYKEIAK